MADYYSPVTKRHYSSKEQMESMEKAYIAELVKVNNELQEEIYKETRKQQELEQKIMENRMAYYNDVDDDDELEIGAGKSTSDKEMRYNLLCDKVGAYYQDIIAFNEWLNHVSEKDYNKYSNIIEKHSKFTESEELTKQEKILKQITTELKAKEDELDDIEFEDTIVVEGMQSYYEKDIDEIKNDISSNKSSIIVCVSLLLSASLITGVILLTASVIAILIAIVVDLFLLDRILRLKKGKDLLQEAVNKRENSINTLNKEIKQLSIQKEKAEKMYNTLLDNINTELETNKEYQKMLPKFEEAQKALDGTYTSNRRKFDAFRCEHYNKEMEMLFKKLEIELDKIPKANIKKMGTIEDYIEYIDDAVEELDNELFEDELSTDPLLWKAIDLAVNEGEVSVQFIEETFKIRKKRAEAIIEQMMERGVITDDLRVLMSEERWLELKSNLD